MLHTARMLDCLGGYGYTENHASYLEVRSQRQQLAYAPTSDHRIMLDFRGVTRRPGRVKPEVIGDMWHVHDKIKVAIGAGEIKDLAWDSLWPKWVAHTGGYELDITQCTIHNKDWIEIVPIRTPDVNAIADRFYKPNTKAPNQPIFKTGKYLVYLCIPWDIYSSWLAYDTEKQAAQYDNKEDDVENNDRESYESEEEESVALVTRTSIPARGASRHTASGSGRQSHSRTSKQHLQSVAAQSSGFPRSSATTRDRSAALNPASFSSRSSLEKENEFNGDHLNPEVMGENTDLDIESPSGLATRSSMPALSKEALVKALSQQTTPSRKEIGSLLNITSISVLASIARERTLSDLLEDSGRLESFLTMPPIDVVLHLDLTPKAQKRGGFKMAALGRSSTRIFGLHAGTGICAKRTYYEQKDMESGTVHYLPHPWPRQAQDLAVEVKCNVWAACLLNDVYAEVDRFIPLSQSEPPAKIPRMRFVKVAFATESKQITAGEEGRTRSLFLVEECIDESREGEFRKYINNNAPTPSSFLFDCENQNRAQFLAFSQHWQFRRTHGLAFVSDYQGGDTLLTDPQIMSDASLGDIFARGNMPSGCKDFPNTHRCNKFCQYFQIAGNFNFPVDMSISVADRPLISSSNGKRKAQGDPDEIRATRRTKVN
ncbi:hypothetical protein B0H13DRAFT_2369254 [Mycena leptocephala]|nr:hypothetical protein B0H13DRAFT_2369254 [Mycena leptocephala]